jgi:hypothetical protein
MLAIWPKAGVNETDRPSPFAGNDQPFTIKPRLRKNVFFEQLRRHCLNPAANRPLGPPNFGQPRRIAILKWAVTDQGRSQKSEVRSQNYA